MKGFQEKEGAKMLVILISLLGQSPGLVESSLTVRSIKL